MKDQGSFVEQLGLRPREAAKVLGVSARTLYNWAQQGILRPIKIGRVCIYPRSLLERFLGYHSEEDSCSEQTKGGSDAQR